MSVCTSCAAPSVFGTLCVRCASARAVAARRGGKAHPRDLWAWLATFQGDPAGFALLVLGMTLWSHQRAVVESVARNPRTSWRSCHGAGKTVTAAVAWLHGLLCFPRALAIFLAPTARQIRQVDWRTVQQIVRDAPALRDLEPPGEVPELGWRPTPDRLGLGLTADKPEGAAGLHAAGRVTVVEDEASGVSQPMHEALLGALVGDARLLSIGNPTRTDGHFFDSFTRKAHLYATFHTSYLDVIREASGIAGVIDQRYADELREDYGEQSAVFQVRAMGEPPSQSSDSVMGLGMIEEARARWSHAIASGAAFEAAGPLQLGVDPARFGDDSSVIVARRGLVALEPIVFHQLDGVALAARVFEVATRLRRHDEAVIVRVDAIGIGASVVDQLGQLGGPLEVVPVNVGEASTVETFERQRDEIWFACRDWLKAGGCLPPDDKLAGELAAPTFGFSPRQRLKVESKDETKKRLRRSPDRADALCLAVGIAAPKLTAWQEWAASDEGYFDDRWVFTGDNF